MNRLWLVHSMTAKYGHKNQYNLHVKYNHNLHFAVGLVEPLCKNVYFQIIPHICHFQWHEARGILWCLLNRPDSSQ